MTRRITSPHSLRVSRGFRRPLFSRETFRFRPRRHQSCHQPPGTWPWTCRTCRRPARSRPSRPGWYGPRVTPTYPPHPLERSCQGGRRTSSRHRPQRVVGGRDDIHSDGLTATSRAVAPIAFDCAKPAAATPWPPAGSCDPRQPESSDFRGVDGERIIKARERRRQRVGHRPCCALVDEHLPHFPVAQSAIGGRDKHAGVLLDVDR